MTPESPGQCRHCNNGLALYALDRDGVGVHVSGKPVVTIGHAADIYWWPCLLVPQPTRMTTEALREALDEEADAAVRAYIDAVADTLGARPIDARVALKRAIERARRGQHDG